MCPKMKHMVQLANEKGASSWLTSLPLADFGFVLNKQEFRDALYLRYGFTLSNLPRYCVCGTINSIDHTLICKRGGYVSMRHNLMRDLEAKLLSEVCRDVVIEPALLPITGETFGLRTANTANEARLDISARRVWTPMDKTFFDIRVFHPGADSNKAPDIKMAYKKHESEKKRSYNSRVLEVEKGTFTPLVFSTTGGMGEEAAAFNKRLASLLSEKRVIPTVIQSRSFAVDYDSAF